MSFILPPDQQCSLASWFCSEFARRAHLTLADRCQLTLCAYDLGIRESHGLRHALDEIKDPGWVTQSVVDALLRQVVLMRFDLCEDQRRAFLAKWIGTEVSRHDIVTVGYAMGLAAEQLPLVTAPAASRVKQWFFKQRDNVESQRLLAWFPRYLLLTGHGVEADVVAQKVLKKRLKNGSWEGDVRATASIAYALHMSGIVPSSELTASVDYLSGRLALGYSQQVAHEATVLKLAARLELLHSDVLTTIRSRMANERSVFLSHSSADKKFVRRLAEDLRAQGARVWLDEAEIRAGESIVTKIELALGEMRYLAVVLTPASVQSAWVQRELNATLVKSLANKSICIIPVLKKSCNIPMLLNDIKYADFRRSYAKGFETLWSALADRAIAPGSFGTGSNRNNRVGTKQRESPADVEDHVQTSGPPAVHVTIASSSFRGTIAQNVTNISTRSAPRFAHPAGSLGADLAKKGYVDYLIARYFEFRHAEGSYGTRRPFSHAEIHKTIQREFGHKTFFMPVHFFDRLVQFLYHRIDKTVLGRNNHSRGATNYHTFEEHLADQSA